MKEDIERLFEIRKKITLIKKEQLKPLEEEKLELESTLMSSLDDMGVEKTAVKGAGTVYIREAIVAKPENWEVFYKFVADNNAFYLLNRALNHVSYREALEQFGEIPGLVSITRRTLGIKAA